MLPGPHLVLLSPAHDARRRVPPNAASLEFVLYSNVLALVRACASMETLHGLPQQGSACGLVDRMPCDSRAQSPPQSGDPSKAWNPRALTVCLRGQPRRESLPSGGLGTAFYEYPTTLSGVGQRGKVSGSSPMGPGTTLIEANPGCSTSANHLSSRLSRCVVTGNVR